MYVCMGHTLNSIYRYYSGKVCTFVLGQMQFDPTLGLGLGQICVYLQNSVLITSPNASQKKSVLPIIRSAIALYLSKGLHTLVTAMLYCVCTLLLVSCWGCFCCQMPCFLWHFVSTVMAAAHTFDPKCINPFASHGYIHSQTHMRSGTHTHGEEIAIVLNHQPTSCAWRSTQGTVVSSSMDISCPIVFHPAHQNFPQLST